MHFIITIQQAMRSIMMSSYNRGWSRVVGFPAGAGHMHDLFAVSRMHYDMAGYRIARPPWGGPTPFGCCCSIYTGRFSQSHLS